MSTLREWIARLWGTLRKSRPDPELEEELRHHLELAAGEAQRRGTTPEGALRAATLKVGAIPQVMETLREQRGLPWLEDLTRDLRYACRLFMKTPGFTIVAILSLALGIGANTAIFSVVHSVLLEPLPYNEPDRLVRIIQNLPATVTIDARPRRVAAMELNELLELRRRTQTFSHVATYDSSSEMTLMSREEPIRVVGTAVSPSLFPVLGTQPFLGRVFREDEEKPGSPQTIILSHATWRNYFASDRMILNRAVTLNGRSHAVIGVMPQGFEFPDRQTACWVPVVLSPLAQGEIRSLYPIGRLKDGIAPVTAAAEVDAIVRGIRESAPDRAERVFVPLDVEVVSIQDELVAPVRRALFVLLGAVGFVLLIACSNVANLLLARSTSRQAEIAVRVALGAGPGRLIRQTLTESCLLAILGGVGGTVLAFAGVRFLRTIGPVDLPRLDEIGIDLTVMVFTLVLSALTALLFGVVPALYVSRVNQTEVIKSGGNAKGSARKRTRSLIVIAEIAMAVVLLTGGGLLIRSFLKLSSVNPGFDATNVLTFQIALPPPVNLSALNENLTEEFRARIQSLPRVRAVAFANALPLVPRSSFSMPRVRGTPIPIEGAPDVRSVSRNYIATMGLRLTQGRDFGENERAGRPASAIISKAMVRYFGGETPIGKTITLGNREAGIIGIVDDIHERGLDIEPRPHVYLDSRQGFGRETAAFALNWAYFVIRAEGDPSSIIPDVRGIVRQMIPGATLRLKVASMEQIVSNSVARPRFYAVLLGLFGVVAVLLATVGVYGITMYSVTQRTREIGIRVAVGARPWQVLALVLSHSVTLTLIGVLIGLGGAVALTRYLDGMLFGLTSLDPATFLLVSIGFASITILASCIPARRAIKVDPLIALRHE